MADNIWPRQIDTPGRTIVPQEDTAMSPGAYHPFGRIQGRPLEFQQQMNYPPALRRPSQAAGPIKSGVPIPPGLQGPSNEQMVQKAVEPVRERLFTYQPKHHGGIR